MGYTPESKPVAYTRETAAEGVENALKMLEGRWKLVILFHLFGGQVMRFSDLERAIRLWRELLAIDPRDGGALDGLVDALRRAEHHTDLVAALDERAGLRVGNGDAQGARQDRVWAAKVLGENLGQTASAVERWVGIEQDHGADEESFETLVQLLEREQRWPELAARIEREAEGTADPTPRAALLVRLAAEGGKLSR